MTRALFFLTLLFLASCGDTIETDEQLLNNIAVLEDQVQKMNEIQRDRGTGYSNNISAEIATTRSTDETKKKRDGLLHIMNKMHEIDVRTSSILELIDQCKFALLHNAGENTEEDVTKDPSSIVWRKHDYRKNQNYTSRLNLSAVKDKGNTEVATSYFISADKTTPSKKGLELWNALNTYRNRLVNIMGSYTWKSDEYNITLRDINSYSDNQDLLEQVTQMIKNSNCNLKEDTQVLIDLYMGLTKPEQVQYGDESMHWISSTFNNSPLVNAIATLTSLEHDILSARALAMAHWSSKINICGNSFSTIMPLAIGPSVAHEGEEIRIKVLMAAFDSDNQPVVTSSVDSATIKYYGDGIGYVRFKPKAGLNTYRGTVAIKNKSGVIKTETWEWTVNVLPE